MTLPVKVTAGGRFAQWGAADTLPVAYGGTGATTAVAARNALGVAALLSGAASTTDASGSNILLVDIPAGTTVALEGVVVARRTGGTAGTAEDGAAYKILAVAKSVGGLAVLIGTPSVTIVGEDVAAYDCTVSANSTNLRIRGIGVAATNIDWSFEGKTTSVS